MAKSNDLVGIGVPPVVASALGWNPASATGAGTAQGGSSPTAYAQSFVMLTTASSQTAITLDSAWPVGAWGAVATITATTGLLFPPSGCKFDNGTTDASTSIAQNKTRLIYRASATLFYTILGG